MTQHSHTLALVSNRLPISFESKDGEITASRSSGGLVTALEPLLKEHGGVWVGSASVEPNRESEVLVEKALDTESKHEKHRFVPVFLTAEEQTNFYEGFSNEIIWPLFHDLQSRCNFNPDYWDFYRLVNDKFAATTMQAAKGAETIWINDYQLLQVAAALRKRGSKGNLAFFLHIPFPAPDIFAKLPWRREVLEGLLKHNLIGLQTRRDQRNLIACLRSYVPDATISAASGRNFVRTVTRGSQKTAIRFFPISIDFEGFSSAAASPEVDRNLAKLRGQMDETAIILGVDRLDYTKGIVERLLAYRIFLRDYPKRRGKTTFIQVVVPSRETIPGYQRLKVDIEQTVTSINGEFAQPGWVPINYIHRSVPRPELLGLYRAAKVALVTPLKDGMNLVAKEYCACRIKGDGVLILSEFAGAAPELGHSALLVNPYDQKGVAAAIDRAFSMPMDEQRRRMSRMRAQIRKADIHHWLKAFLSELGPARSES